MDGTSPMIMNAIVMILSLLALSYEFIKDKDYKHGVFFIMLSITELFINYFICFK